MSSGCQALQPVSTPGRQVSSCPNLPNTPQPARVSDAGGYLTQMHNLDRAIMVRPRHLSQPSSVSCSQPQVTFEAPLTSACLQGVQTHPEGCLLQQLGPADPQQVLPGADQG